MISRETMTNHLRRYFSSGWLFFLPFLGLWIAWRMLPLPPELLRPLEIGVLVATTGLAVFWLISDRRNLNPETGIFLLLLAVLFSIFGPNLEFPGDNWTFWSRAKFPEAEGNLIGLGESINGAIIAIFPESWWAGSLRVPAVFWGVAGCYQFFRFARAMGFDPLWARIAVISVLFFMGTLGLPYFQHIILGRAMLGFLAQMALFTELVQAVRRNEFRNLWLIAPLLAIAGAGHLQNVIMSVLGLCGIMIWWGIQRFGWRKGGGTLLIVALLFWGLFDWFLFRGALQVRIEEIISGNVWLTSTGSFNLLGSEGRALLPLGIIGIVNIFAGLFLVTQNRVLGWLTIFPILALLYPPFAKVYAYALSEYDDLIVFNRVLFLVPCTFALLLSLKLALTKTTGRLAAAAPVAAGLVFLTFAAIPQRPNFGKLAYWIDKPSASLRLAPNSELIDWVREKSKLKPGDLIITDEATDFLLRTDFLVQGIGGGRWYPGRVQDCFEDNAEMDKALDEVVAVVLVNKPCVIPPRPSFMGRLYQHSPPLLVKHDLTYSPEIIRKFDLLVENEGWTREEAPPFYYWYEPPSSE